MEDVLWKKKKKEEKTGNIESMLESLCLSRKVVMFTVLLSEGTLKSSSMRTDTT